MKNMLIVAVVISMAAAVVSIAAGGCATGYATCTARPAACGAVAPGKNGYVCVNESAVCRQGSDGAEDLRCKTVAGEYFWESPCECKCRP